MKKILTLFIIISYPIISFSQENPDDGKIFTLVEQMPQFQGGEAGMVQYLRANIHYPPNASDNKIEGTVYITFIIDTSGNVNDVRLLRGIGEGCDEEALRVVRAMPQWTAGKQSGKKVKVQYNIPIKFTLGKGSDEPNKSYNSKNISYYNQGIELFKFGHYEEAIECFTTAIKEDKKDVDSYYNRAASFKKLEFDKAACNDWKKAKELGDKGSEKMYEKYCGLKDTENVIEVLPEYIEGKDAGLIKYLYKNLKYPSEAKEKIIEGTVYISFTIDSMGRIEDAKVLKGIGEGCDEEALRLINSMPYWKPGTQNGNAANFQLILPIRFKILKRLHFTIGDGKITTTEIE